MADHDAISRLCTTCKSAVPIACGLGCLRRLSPVDARPMFCGAERIGTTGCGPDGKLWEPRTDLAPGIASILANPAASYWLKAALGGLVGRDPVDAVNDAEILAELMNAQANRIQGTTR